ncbi:sugar ABC transporter permease [uncultured Acetatifactor sp.]|jgi:putative aldouronate transport system permease protein|uniref:ABC transporter permease n=1 Tax=uncultured Acetatifactor sp. TaxID=1671927 RepID=UPI00261BE4BC|nr:ABC transporter permease subunit [uncultured Acetatifactor sp.]
MEIQKKKESLGIRLWKNMKKNWILYVMIAPVAVYYIVFAYTPMYGILLAFKNYKVKLGILGSPWVGLDHFQRFFSAYNFKQLIGNTVGISVYSLIIGFPIPIVFALMLNYLTHNRLKKVVQMVSYAPYFISTVVICGMITIFMAPDTGILNVIRGFFGLESVNFLAKPEWFKSIYVWTGVWQGMGWSSIIYISALAGVDYEMHEAAIVDGATKIQRMIHVDLPSIKPTILMLLILQMGSIMNVGFEKVYLLQNTLNKSAASVISTYVYEVGLINSDYGYSTAVGLFNSLINLGLVVAANQLSKRFAGESLF